MREIDVEKLTDELYECMTMLELQLIAMNAVGSIEDPFAYTKTSKDFLSASFALHQQLIEKIDNVHFTLAGGE
ncbi:hypothetical protein [Falseniella ignava]|uniref:Uncharacterized protein n=1 Tax=Falseniella ignava CCUG 37419 TaxID=883112 RepID=K1LNP8_9LACT|nr:hypothetical protein [Falseniella ignava]EKB53732.1 hypothetical protein HMPREF9707_01485 [Falseniella ignava CCUG 37419]